jgi:hypothetical protein
VQDDLIAYGQQQPATQAKETSRDKLRRILSGSLNEELEEIITLVTSKPGDISSFYVPLPDPSIMDADPQEIATLVARTSNMYSRVARFAGIARAEYKIAEANYKRAFKRGLSNAGKNTQEREAKAMEMASEEQEYMSLVDSVVQLVESAENASRIASESSRKLYDKVQAVRMGEVRYNRVADELF